MDLTMSADSLPAPEGVAYCKYVDGVRIIAAYYIQKDCIRATWATVINGNKHLVYKDTDSSESLDEFVERETADSRKLLLAAAKDASIPQAPRWMFTGF